MFAAGKYPENPWCVVMSKDSVGIWRKSEAKPGRVLPSLFRDTRKPVTNIVSYNVQKCEIFVENFSNRHFAANAKLREITIKYSLGAILERNMKQSKCIENQDALSSFIHFNISKYILYKTIICKISLA